MTTPVFDINEAIADAVKTALPAAPEETTATEAPAAESAADAESATENAEEALLVEDTAEPQSEEASEESAVALPDGYVAVPTVNDQLATEFAIYDAEGEVEIPALMVEYKANGKVRRDRLDQVVKLAQWGVYNEERDRKSQTVEQQYQQVLSTAQQLEQLVAEREAQLERMLQDDEFLYAAREAYEKETSPERRAARAEQEAENLRLSYEMQHISQQGQQFYQAEVMPAVQMIVNALPHVSQDELESRLEMVMQAHAEIAPNGQPYVPPSRYDAIRQYIVEDLAVWAQMVNVKRGQPVTNEQQAVRAELERARIEAQKAKNALGRVTKPSGQAGKPGSKPQAAPSTVDDAVASALSSALASFATS